ncbi:MAG: cyclic nucleotide-binding domain-containing protein [Myxococcales bacterium]|nr:cyclic nucleotide-binding domain-containing protein [Myxococcales bacterium]MCB9641952.1 cyclic nucleotide-binding domain-containing protein [Myxococcales bacterium]
MKPQELKPFLAEHPFFAELPAEDHAILAACAAYSVFEAGDLLFREGEEATSFFVLREGSVGIDIHYPTRGLITLMTLGKGDIVGWSWLLPPYRSQFDARAIRPTKALIFDAVKLRASFEQHPELGYAVTRKLLAQVTQRLFTARIQLLDLYGISTTP